jgi:chorismate mutase/prephenate dehydratase
MGKARSDSQDTELLKLRTDIDRIDGEILEALNRRAEVVLQVAKLKRDMKSKFYVPNREQEVINRLKKLNKGPFPNDALKPLFRRWKNRSR